MPKCVDLNTVELFSADTTSVDTITCRPKAYQYLLIGSAIWPVDMHTRPIQKMFKFPMVGPQIIPPAQAGNFPEFPGISGNFHLRANYGGNLTAVQYA